MDEKNPYLKWRRELARQHPEMAGFAMLRGSEGPGCATCGTPVLVVAWDARRQAPWCPVCAKGRVPDEPLDA